jgi:hypothetical protein
MYQEAQVAFDKRREIPGGLMFAERPTVAIMEERMGKAGEAQRVLEELLELSKTYYVQPTALATLHFSLGEDKKGFEQLEKAYNELDYFLYYTNVDPLYKTVRSDPRFMAILKKIGLDK